MFSVTAMLVSHVAKYSIHKLELHIRIKSISHNSEILQVGSCSDLIAHMVRRAPDARKSSLYLHVQRSFLARGNSHSRNVFIHTRYIEFWKTLRLRFVHSSHSKQSRGKRDLVDYTIDRTYPRRLMRQLRRPLFSASS